ncbi:hypothetical protein K461DRAFT_225110 [Myriangium duriaei CBS 260.36]|uniref:Methyltransferase domain-containing protein n=1 Tax=Myriangium duriaei CBS 260.36 TaxID=1168546 RepID=A0A9P4J2N5_9PEZI|nr:hypothetical protein K461DRAFT_225110 [Myriangium duriaei CBS 260.36]
MGPEYPLPISGDFTSTDQYVEELLDFVTASPTLTTLCGGVHILDFFTTEPDLYSSVIPQSWREFFAELDIMDLLDLLMRDDLATIRYRGYKNGSMPPPEFLEYIENVRRLSFNRTFDPPDGSQTPKIDRDVALGMGIKKVHEVGHFSRFIHDLSATISAESASQGITHLIDLGSGQGYLLRALASTPYHHNSVGVESRQNNIDGSKNWDIMAKLAPKPKIRRDKKTFRAERAAAKANGTVVAKPDPSVRGERGFFHHPGLPETNGDPEQEDIHVSTVGKGSVQYISHYLVDGDLTRVVQQIVSPSALSQVANSEEPLTQDEANSLPRAALTDVNALVISLHSCGNLLHHGLRSLLLTPSVRAVAMVGCCYNLLTERLGPPSYKLPNLRAPNARLEELAAAHDPHGFPMSNKFCTYTHPTSTEVGVRLNITARMMAVQAPQNWGTDDSAAFFTRHFYRALLQRIFVDLKLIPAPSAAASPPPTSTIPETGEEGEEKPDSTPVILGSLPARAYASFTTYVRAAASKLSRHTLHPSTASRGAAFAAALSALSDEQIAAYETRFAHRRHQMATVWSLMAFSAGAVEALIVTDRWLWLREQEEVGTAWVQSVFEYGVSPRNLVVVGVKR